MPSRPRQSSACSCRAADKPVCGAEDLILLLHLFFICSKWPKWECGNCAQAHPGILKTIPVRPAACIFCLLLLVPRPVFLLFLLFFLLFLSVLAPVPFLSTVQGLTLKIAPNSPCKSPCIFLDCTPLVRHRNKQLVAIATACLARRLKARR